MRNTGIGDRLIALFLFGLLLFSPPALSIFSTDSLFAGMPVLFVYLFGAWLALVILVGAILRPRAREAPESDGMPGDEPEGR